MNAAAGVVNLYLFVLQRKPPSGKAFPKKINFFLDRGMKTQRVLNLFLPLSFVSKIQKQKILSHCNPIETTVYLLHTQNQAALLSSSVPAIHIVESLRLFNFLLDKQK